MTSTHGSTGNDGKGNPESECPADREETSESSVLLVEHEDSGRSYAWKDIEEDTRRLCCTLSEPSGPGMLKVELALRYRLRGNDMPSIVVLYGFGSAQFEVMSV